VGGKSGASVGQPLENGDKGCTGDTAGVYSSSLARTRGTEADAEKSELSFKIRKKCNERE